MISESLRMRMTDRPALVRRAVNRFRPYRQQLLSHFVFEIGGVRIAYCYIRKNACSAFKRMMLGEAGYTGEWHDAIGFLQKNFGTNRVADVRSADWRVFVYRDPFDRAVSLFRNKMVMPDDARDFLRSYAEVTGSDPLDATFDKFVRSYLSRSSLDPHAHSQSSHLLPVSYNLVANIETLAEDIRPIIGDKLATRYFARLVNESSAALFSEPSSDVPVRLLRERYGETGELPGIDALDNPELRSMIRRIYRSDYKLSPR